MTWTKLDDAAPQHPKAKTAGNDAWALWVAAIVYSNRYLTDGIVSVAVLATECLPQPISIAKARKLAEQLCDCKTRPDGSGLFERVEGGFYRIHDFAEYNPTKAEVEAKRAWDRDRKRGGGRGGGGNSGAPPAGIPSGNPHGIPSGIPEGKGADSERIPRAFPTHAGARPPVPSRPDPTRPDPAPASLGDRAKLWLDDPNRAAFEHPQPHRWPEVLRLGERLAAVFGLPVEAPRQPRDPRCLVPLQRYAEGYTEGDLLEAIEGAKQSRAIGENREYQVLATILRDAAQVDKLRALAPPSGTLRKAPTVAERIAADRASANADRKARGLPPLGDSQDAISDPAELDRILRSVGNG